MDRIVSLLPGATEIVCALGFGDRLVGRSHECDHPPSVRSLPALTEPKFAPAGTAREIDDRVRGLVQEGLAVYRVDAERLRALEPTVLVTQTQCEVCAVSRDEVEAALRDWVGARPRLVSLEPMRLADVWDDVRRVAAALGAAERGEALVAELEVRVASLADRARSAGARPSVALVEWLDPLMAGGNWMPELVELAGGRALFGTAGEHSPWLEWDALRDADPDVVVVAPCGYGIAQTRAELEALTGRPGWAELRAVREGRVALADGHHFFNRSGPRLVETLEILAEVFHPGAFDFGHRGAGWVPA